MKRLFLFFCLMSVIASRTSANFHMVDHYISIGTSIPPAMIVVTDSAGNKAGVDVSKPVDAFGRGTRILEIQGSDVDQVNIASDESPLNQPQANTSWTISFIDQPTQTYSVNLIGIDTGVVQILESSGYKLASKKDPPVQKQSFLVERGISRTAQITFDPTAGALTITPIVNRGDFLRDTQSACGLKDIAPETACDVLGALASNVERAITEGDADRERQNLELYLRILNRLHNWGNKHARQNWDDFKGHSECDELLKDKDDTRTFAKDPVYLALKLDAETLLKTLSIEKDIR
jgi:hypothetical protein